MGFVRVHVESFLQSVASPFHSFVTTMHACNGRIVHVSKGSNEPPSTSWGTVHTSKEQMHPGRRSDPQTETGLCQRFHEDPASNG